jgi:hypothetical protein
MVNKITEGTPISLDTREIQIKPTMKYQLLPLPQIAKIEKTDKQWRTLRHSWEGV